MLPLVGFDGIKGAVKVFSKTQIRSFLPGHLTLFCPEAVHRASWKGKFFETGFVSNTFTAPQSLRMKGRVSCGHECFYFYDYFEGIAFISAGHSFW